MVMPSGRRSSEPGPLAITSGSAPSSAASVVIVMGRKRSMQASKIARSGGSPWARSPSSAKSTIMIPFFLTMPMRRMTPTSAIRLKSKPNAIRIASAPTPADGRVDRIVSGWM